MPGYAQLSGRRVHAAPLGFEEDRIVIPAVTDKADRVWLLVPQNDNAAAPFLEGVRTRLSEERIKVRTMAHDREDLFDIIRATREIIQEEEENGVQVNLSSGSKIQAIGCMMACMMFNPSGRVRPYYAEPEEYSHGGPLSSGVRNITRMPQHTIPVPPPLLAGAMHLIKGQNNRVRKKDLLYKLRDAGLVVMTSDSAAGVPETADVMVVRSVEHNMETVGLARMTGNIIDPLVRQNLATTEKVGRSQWVSLTKEGLNAVQFLPDPTS